MRRFRPVAVLLALATAASLSMLGAVPASADSAGPIYNYGNGRCIVPVELAQGATVEQQSCDITADVPSQWWDYSCVSEFDGVCYTFQIYNHASPDLCLDAAGGNTNGTRIQLWPCNGISNEVWDYSPPPTSPDAGSGTPFFGLRSRVSGTTSHCLDVPGNRDVDEALQLYACNGTVAQEWAQDHPFSL